MNSASANSAAESGGFDEVVLPHVDLVYRMAVKLARDPHEAEDLVQETFLRAHRSFGQFELREYGAKPWLLKILHNVFFSRWSQKNRGPTLMDDLSLDDLAADLERDPMPSFDHQDVDWDHFDEELKFATEALAPEYRSVLLLWALGDLSYKEIAEVLGCALGTVMSRLHRARQQLSMVLHDYAARRGFTPRPATA